MKTTSRNERNQQKSSGVLHSSSTLNNNNDTCHVALPLFIGLHWIYFSFEHHRVIQSPFGTSFAPSGSILPPLTVDESLVSCTRKGFLSHFPKSTLVCVPSRESPLIHVHEPFALSILHNKLFFYHHPSSRKGAPLVFCILCPSATFTT